MSKSAILISFAGLLAAQPGSVDGTVIEQSSARPLGSVHVRLYAGVSPEMATAAYGAMTSSDGHFSIASILPGTYTVVLEHAGFVAAPGDAGFAHSTEIAVRAGEHVSGRKLAMLPLVPIAGRVLNYYGDPVPDIEVHVIESGTNSPRYLSPYQNRMTDQRGQFRLFVVPGKYYVMAGSVSLVGPYGPVEIRTDGSSDMGYAGTYYPNALDEGAAGIVEAKAGGEVAGLEIHLRPTAARRNLRLSGKVTGIPAGAKAHVIYRFGESPGKFQMSSRDDVGEDGGFSFENLPPGYFGLLAVCCEDAVDLQSDLVELHLEPSGGVEVQLALAPGGVVSGTLEIDGTKTPATAGKFTVQLFDVEPGFGFGPNLAAVDSDGSFRIVAVAPGHFRVHVSGLPENGYVRSIFLDDVANDGPLDFSRGVRGARLKIIVSLNGAEISGTVQPVDDGPPLNTRTTVFLEAESKGIGPSQPAAPVIEGRYSLRGIPPGKYKLFAADAARVMGESRAAFLAAAETVEVTEGGRVTRNLKLVVPEASSGDPKR